MFITLYIFMTGLVSFYVGYNKCKKDYEEYMKEIHQIYLEKLTKDDNK